MTSQDEIVIKGWLSTLHVLVEGLQAQVNELKEQVSNLQKVPEPTPVAPKKTKAKEEPETPPAA